MKSYLISYKIMLPSEFQTKEEQEEFNNLIRNSIVYDFNIEETQAYIKNKIGVEVPLATISKIINNVQLKDIKSRLSLYKNNSNESVYEDFESIEVIKVIQKELKQICDKNTADPFLQVECITQLRECTTLLMKLNNRIFGIPLKI